MHANDIVMDINALRVAVQFICAAGAVAIICLLAEKFMTPKRKRPFKD